MKGFENKDLEYESNFDGDGMDMSIEKENMGFIFDIMFNQMYRDPIGSLIREITSNCFDSHTEAGVKDAVVITFGSDDGGEYILFKDVGIGISPERMKKIYSKPASSTKRDTQDQIGYWGLGSKSPLAYADYFNLDTVSDGIKYEYIVHKGEKVPRIEPMDQYETTEHNGTEVKIYIRDGDKSKFFNKLVEQLRYFDNVFVKNCYSFNNNYKLYEGKTFKFRSDAALDTPLHLCIGKVVYPIDWRLLKREQIKLPLGVKFAIGELPITPERESIKYTKINTPEGEVDVVDLVNKRIDECVKEVLSLEAANPRDHNNLQDYFINKDKGSFIRLLGVRIDTDNLFDKPRRHRYVPLDDWGLQVPENVFWQYSVVAWLKVRKVDLQPRRLTWKDTNNHYIVRIHSDTGKIAQVKLDYMREQATRLSKNTVYFVRKHYNGHPSAREILENLNLRKRDVGMHDYEANQGWVKRWKQFDKAMEIELIVNSVDINDVVVPDQWAKEWKKSHSKKKDGQEWVEGEEIPVKDMKVFPKTNRDRIVDLDDAQKFKGFILYGYSDDEKILSMWADAFRVGEFEPTARIIMIRHKHHVYLQTIPHAVYVHHFMSNNPIFRKVANAVLVDDSKVWDKKFYPKAGASYSKKIEEATDMLGDLFLPLSKAITELNTVRKNTIALDAHNTTSAEYKEFIQEIKDLATENNWFDPETKAKLNRVENYFEDLELLSFIPPDRRAVPYIGEYLQFKGKKVNPLLANPETWEIQLLKETQDKFTYLVQIKDEALKTKTGYYQDWTSNVTYQKNRLKSLITDNLIDEILLQNNLIKYHEQRTNKAHASRAEHHPQSTGG